MADQPSTKTYGVAELQLFTTYDRDTYKTRFGVQAPAYDASRSPKTWFDSTALVGRSADALVEYTIFQNNAFTTLTMKASEAASVNLTGRYEYAVYAPAATVATSGGVGVNPRALISETDARALVTELVAAGASVKLLEQDNSLDTNWGTETRRRFTITFADGVACDAAGLLSEKYIAGVGAPGHWVIITGAEPIWVVESQDDGAKAGAAVAVPVRPLLSNEKLVIGWAGLAYVERTDIETGDDIPAATTTGLTSEQAAELSELASGVKSIQGVVTALATDMAKLKSRLGVS